MGKQKRFINQSPTGKSTGGGYINVYFVEVEKGRWEYVFGENKDIPEKVVDDFINNLQKVLDVLNAK